MKEPLWAMGFWEAADFTIDEQVVRFVRGPNAI